MRRSERLIERGLEFRSRQEAAGGRRQNPAWSRPPPPPRRTRTPPHGAAAAMASPSRSRSRSPRARRPPRGLARAASAPSPRRPAPGPRPPPLPGPRPQRVAAAGPAPRGRWRAAGGAPGPPREAPGQAHLGRASGPRGSRGTAAAERSPSGALGRGLSAASRRAPEPRRFRSPSCGPRARGAAATTCPSSDPARTRPTAAARVQDALARGCRTPTALGLGRTQAEPAEDSVSSWGEWSWGETSPDPPVAAHVNAQNGGSAVPATHRGAPQSRWPGVRAAPIRPSCARLGRDRKSLGAPLCIPPHRFSGTALETSCSSDTSVFTPFGAETWKE